MPLSPERIYWFGTHSGPAARAQSSGDRRDDVLARFDGWHEKVTAVVRATAEEAILHHDIVDRAPRRGWSQGRVTLLGDAAHPMTPHLGQGACQAIEDAVVLVDCLRRHDGLEPALRAYEAARFGRTARMVRESRRVGRIAQLRNPVASRLRDAALKIVPARAQMRQVEAMVRFSQA